MGRNRKKGGAGAGATTATPVPQANAGTINGWEQIGDNADGTLTKVLPDGTVLTIYPTSSGPNDFAIDVEQDRSGGVSVIAVEDARNADGTFNMDAIAAAAQRYAEALQSEEPYYEDEAELQSGLIDFLNEIGRETGAPGFFDRLLRGEPVQSPQAVAESRKLADESAKAADTFGTVVQRMAPDQMNAQQAAAARQAIIQGIQAAGGALSKQDLADMQRIAGMLSPNFVERQRNRVLGGIAALGRMHADVATALRRGTNAGIQEALDRTSRVEDGLRTTVDTVMQGALQQDALVRRLNALSKRAERQGFPEPARQAIIQAIRSLPLVELEKSSSGAVGMIARLGRNGLLPSVQAVAQARQLGGRQNLQANVQETAEGIARAITIRREQQGQKSPAKQITDRLRTLERASAVARSGR